MPESAPGAAMSVAEFVGYIASGLVFLTFSMKTMIPLRVAAIGSNIAFIAYGAMASLYPILILHLVLLPMNCWRTVQMVLLVRRVKAASGGDLSVEWLKPFMKSTRHAAGTTLFHRGEQADRMFYLVSGTIAFAEIDVTLQQGNLFGEIGLFSPDRRRTQTATCRTAAEILWITYDELAQLCYQNPAVAFHLMRVLTGRLMENADKAHVRAGLDGAGHNREG